MYASVGIYCTNMHEFIPHNVQEQRGNMNSWPSSMRDESISHAWRQIQRPTPREELARQSIDLPKNLYVPSDADRNANYQRNVSAS